MAIQTFTSNGSKASVAAKLAASVFEVEIKSHELMKAAYVAYLANGRENLAKTKTRAMVSGGGKKPWRQKGTGRARFGSSRVPIWRSGGIAMGPTGNENYTHNITVGMKRGALRHALTTQVQGGKLVVMEKLEVSSGKTKDLVTILQKMGAERSTLLITDVLDAKVQQASRNIDRLKVIRTKAANVYDVMNADLVIVTAGAVEEMSDWLGREVATSKTIKKTGGAKA